MKIKIYQAVFFFTKAHRSIFMACAQNLFASNKISPWQKGMGYTIMSVSRQLAIKN